MTFSHPRQRSTYRAISASLRLVILSAAVTITSALPASASLVIDLRFADGSTTKNLSAMSAGQTVTIQVWATVTGGNTTQTDDGLAAATFGVLSTNTTASLAGSLVSGSFTPPFDLIPISMPGTFADRNADGVGDWRGTSTVGVTPLGWPRAGSGITPVLGGGAVGQSSASDSTRAWEFHIADAVFQISSISVPAARIDALKFNVQIPVPAIKPALGQWLEDGLQRLGSATNPSAGTGVTFTLGVEDGPDIDPTPNALSFNVLRNAAAAAPVRNVVLFNVGFSPGSYSTSTSGIASVVSGGSGVVVPGTPGIISVALMPSLMTTYGAFKTGTIVVNTTGDPDLPSADTVNVVANVGEATTTGPTFAGAPVFTAVVPTAVPASSIGSYAGLASRTTAGSGNVGTEAILRGGQNGTGPVETVGMQWRQRGDLSPLFSDVVSLSGLAAADTSQNSFGRTKTDPYVLQLTYDPTLLPGGISTEAATILRNGIVLGWSNPMGTSNPADDQWQNAVLGNFNNSPSALWGFKGTWTGAGSPLTVGSWGIDDASNVVWAVLDHASEFAVIPEPNSMVLLGLGGAAVLGIVARRKRPRASGE